MVSRPNIIFLLIDNLRYDCFSQRERARYLYPNLAGIAEQGALHKIISNGHATKFAMPAVFTQTYPLDYKGYNWGIVYRPRSFVEELRAAGYYTLMIQGDDNDGPLNQCERGFDKVEAIYDRRLLIQNYLQEVLIYEIDKWEQGKYSDAELGQLLNDTLAKILRYLITTDNRIIRFGLPGKLSKVDRGLKKRIQKELVLISTDPRQVARKIQRVAPHLYYLCMGRKTASGLRLLYGKFLYRVFGRIQQSLKRKGLFPFRVLTSRKSPLASELLYPIHQLTKGGRQPWFAYAHLMDLHDRRLINRPVWVLRKMFDYVKWRKCQPRQGDFQWFLYDAALMAVDRQVGKLISRLKQSEGYENTLFVITGDHGCEMDDAKLRGCSEDFGFRSHPEHIEVPMIIGPTVATALSGEGVHDTMSVSAGILDLLGIPPHESFKGQSVFDPGRRAVVSENAGRGNADLIEKDLYFTVTSTGYKMMAVLRRDVLQIERLYDRSDDPVELENVVSDVGKRAVLCELVQELFDQRKSLLMARGITSPEQVQFPDTAG